MAFAIFKLKDTITAAAMQMRGIVEPEHSVFAPFVDTQYRHAGRQDIDRKVQSVDGGYIQPQPMKNNILDRAFMGDDQKVFPLQIGAF